MKISNQNLISTPRDRKNRQHEKQKMVLQFLRQHIWSNQLILQQVMSVQSRQEAHKTLCAIEQNGFLRRHTYDALGGKITIWGITHQGQAMAFDFTTEQIISTYFEPGRVSEQTIRHQLDIQQLRLKAEVVGWHNWIDGDRLGNADKHQKRPDALARNSSGDLVAVECERTFKSLKRYEQVLDTVVIRCGRVKSS